MAWQRLNKLQSWRIAAALLIACLLVWALIQHENYSVQIPDHPLLDWSSDLTDWTFDPARDGNDLGLSANHCAVAFPRLYQEIDRAQAWHRAHRRNGRIREKDIKPYDGRAQVRLMIYDGQLRLISRYGLEGPHVTDRSLATIQAIHRAISSVPHPRYLPNVEFTIDVQDDGKNGGPKNTIWSYCRQRSAESTWVMPDFGFWSHPSNTLGSYGEFRSKVNVTEEQDGFRAKKPKLVWRGAEVNGGDVRRALVDASRGKRWSDVQFLDWGDEKTILDMHEHCRYQFAAHTEGATWSGRLRYLQNCNNVVVTHKLDYIAHYYPLLVRSGVDQNIVEVDRNFAGLNAEMLSLLEDPTEAERIATNGAKVFRDRYLTPAAEACYWRRMFVSWRAVQGWEPRLWTDGRKGEEGKKRWRGVSWEQYSMTGKDWGTNAHN